MTDIKQELRDGLAKTLEPFIGDKITTETLCHMQYVVNSYVQSFIATHDPGFTPIFTVFYGHTEHADWRQFYGDNSPNNMTVKPDYQTEMWLLGEWHPLMELINVFP